MMNPMPTRSDKLPACLLNEIKPASWLLAATPVQ